MAITKISIPNQVKIVADLDFNAKKITNLAEPSLAQDAATKNYVDTVAQGLRVKAAVRAATVGTITLSGAQTIDGVVLTAGNRVLVKNQTTSSQNGIYAVATGAWTRTSDADSWDQLTSAFVFVESGSTQADTGWVCTVDTGAAVLETTTITWVQFSGAGSYTAGTGLTLAGTAFALDTARVATGSINGLMSSSDFTKLSGIASGAEVNQLAYSAITINGAGSMGASTKTDTFNITNGNGITLTGGTRTVAIGLNVDTSLDISTSTLKIKAGGVLEAHIGTGAVTTDKIGAGAITEAKINSSALSTTGGLSGGSGTKLSVNIGSGLTMSTNTIIVNKTNVAFLADMIEQSYTATEGQTTFSLTAANTGELAVEGTLRIGMFNVFHNGIKLRYTEDYTKPSGTSVLLVSAAKAGDNVIIQYYRG